MSLGVIKLVIEREVKHHGLIASHQTISLVVHSPVARITSSVTTVRWTLVSHLVKCESYLARLGVKWPMGRTRRGRTAVNDSDRLCFKERLQWLSVVFSSHKGAASHQSETSHHGML